MRKHLQFLMATVLSVFLVFCTDQQGKDQPIKNISQTAGELLDGLTLIEEIDTLFAPNAPLGITRKARKDKKDNLLIAAFTDVISYNGKAFSKIPKPVGVESFDAFDALEDSQGNTWIASTHFGVFRYDGKNFTHFTSDDGLAHNRTMDIHEDKAGNIWIATLGGASYYDGSSFQNFTTKDGIPDNDVSSIIEDRTGKTWFGTRGGACYYDPSSSTFMEISNDQGEPLGNVRSIVEDKNGIIWLAGEEGIWRYDRGLLMRVLSEGGNSMYEDKNGNIWFTYKNTLSCFSKASLNLNTPKPTVVFVGEGMFFGISEDKEGKIWVGTLQGVFTYDGKSIHYHHGVEL